MNARELKPCPFCGGDRTHAIPANRNSTERLYPIVRCMGCFTDVPGKTGDYGLDCKTAVAAWNRRAPILRYDETHAPTVERAAKLADKCASMAGRVSYEAALALLVALPDAIRALIKEGGEDGR